MRPRRPLLALVIVAALVTGAGALVYASTGGPGATSPPAAGVIAQSQAGQATDLGTAPAPLALRLNGGRDVVVAPFKRKRQPAAGVLFDMDTGRVLWRREPTERRPIASLTKIMTALVVVDRTEPGDRARITRADARVDGSAVGALPVGREVGVQTLLYGLMLASGNDAARVLARRAAGSRKAFVAEMNRMAGLLRLSCTHFTTPDGLRDRGNRSCAADLAAMARALMRDPRLARIVGTRRVILPWPVKRGQGRRLELVNHNPLLLQNYKGVTGVKTGFTNAAGPCFVVTARRGGVHLGLVLLDSPDIDGQARTLLGRGFRASGV